MSHDEPERCECGGLARAYPYIPAGWDGRDASIHTQIKCELCGAATAPFDNYKAVLNRWNRKPPAPIRLLAAWRAGRDAAAKAVCPYCAQGRKPKALNDYDGQVMHLFEGAPPRLCNAAFALALPDPSPSELEALR